MQIAAACVASLPGVGLLATAVVTRDVSFAMIGGSLVAIGAASLSERVVGVVQTWFSNMWPGTGRGEKAEDTKSGGDN